MALERKDARLKLDHDVHAALKEICEVEGVDMGEWIETAILPLIKKRIHDATVLAARLHRLGITGSGREKPGAAGNDAS